MAVYERKFQGGFDDAVSRLHESILNGSLSASYEGGSDYSTGNVRCAVRVYERYSLMGSNRLSLSVTLVGEGESLFLSAITAGGSQGAFLKINTWGEESFLDCLREIADKL